MNPEIQLLADLDVALAHVFSQVEQRPLQWQTLV